MAVDQYTLPQNYNIDYILPDQMYEAGLGNPAADDDLLDIAPPVSEDADAILWEQLENGYGLASLRGLGNAPDVVTVPGARRNAIAPGYYGERFILDEVEMDRARELGTPNEPLDIADRLGKQIIPFAGTRVLNQMRQTLATLAVTGSFRNVGKSGAVVHEDSLQNYHTFSPLNDAHTGPGWSADPANATPINDLQYWQSQLQIVTDSDFGPKSKIIFNPNVLVDLFRTAQFRELYRDKYGATVTPGSLDEFASNFGLGRFRVYRRSYSTTAAAAVARTGQYIMPDKSLIWAGTRPQGQKIAQFVFTRNMPLALLHGGAPAPLTARSAETYPWATGLGISMKIKDELPWSYQLDVWFNGGPRVNYPSALAGITYS